MVTVKTGPVRAADAATKPKVTNRYYAGARDLLADRHGLVLEVEVEVVDDRQVRGQEAHSLCSETARFGQQ